MEELSLLLLTNNDKYNLNVKTKTEIITNENKKKTVRSKEYPFHFQIRIYLMI